MPVEEHWISVSDLQRRLAQKATEEPEHRFGGLYDLLTWETVLDGLPSASSPTRALGPQDWIDSIAEV
jgi:hypothetical protein